VQLPPQLEEQVHQRHRELQQSWPFPARNASHNHQMSLAACAKRSDLATPRGKHSSPNIHSATGTADNTRRATSCHGGRPADDHPEQGQRMGRSGDVVEQRKGGRLLLGPDVVRVVWADPRFSVSTVGINVCSSC
jgi:hypothetical protein